eukprot:3152565-Prymnesium_polylepis.1
MLPTQTASRSSSLPTARYARPRTCRQHATHTGQVADSRLDPLNKISDRIAIRFRPIAKRVRFAAATPHARRLVRRVFQSVES